METLVKDLEKHFNIKRLKDSENVFYVDDCADSFMEIIDFLKNKGLILISLFAAEDFGKRGFSLMYIFEKKHSAKLLAFNLSLKDRQAVSVARIFPIACYFEREIRDGFGIEFAGAFDRRRLLLHEAYPDDFHPLLKSFKNRHLDLRPEKQKGTEYIFKAVDGEGVYQIPVGPVHAGIIEPGHFRFGVMGETIFNLEIRHFYKHRGLEKLAENKKTADCVAIAESISGDESAANATAYAMAIEQISECIIPKRAWQIRTVLLEMERIYSHLGDLAGMQVDVAFPMGASPLFILREEILRYNATLTGSRFLKGIIVPGGLKQDISTGKLKALKEYMNDFKKRLAEAVKIADNSSWVIDRFETTGIVKNELIAPLNLTGPIARASGANIDTRHDHPYGIYSKLKFSVPVKHEGDVLARFRIKTEEIYGSLEIIGAVIDRMQEGIVCTDCPNKDGYALAMLEAPRGQNLHWVYVKNGVIERYKIRTASFCNWWAIEHAVPGNIVPDFPVINKSMNLSYAGNDL